MNPLFLDGSSVAFQESSYPYRAVEVRVSVDASQRVVLVKPRQLLTANTDYSVSVNVRDTAGNYGWGSMSFSTGEGVEDVTAPVVLGVSPADGSADVPVNARVVVRLSEAVDRLSVGSGTAQLWQGSVVVGAALALSEQDGVLTVTPLADLVVSTAYRLVLDGVRDVSGNALVRFESAFTTRASTVRDTVGPQVVQTVPVNGATEVSLSPEIRVTFSEAVDPVTVTAETVSLAPNGMGRLPAVVELDGTGTVATLRPGVSLAPQKSYSLRVSGVTDLAGNGGWYSGGFTTGAGVLDTVPPEVMLVTPGDGATGVTARARVVLTFSEPLDAGTVTVDTVALFADGTELSVGMTRSSDNTVVTVYPNGTLSAGSWVWVVVTEGVNDLAGNAHRGFYSTFQVEAERDETRPTVVGVRPQNGATGVLPGSAVSVMFSEPMDLGTVGDAAFVSEDGTLVEGVWSGGAGGRVARFEPARPLKLGSLVQVFVTEYVSDVSGNGLAGLYQSSFRVAADPLQSGPSVVAFHPLNGAGGVPVNAVLTARMSEPIDPATLNGQTLQVSSYYTGTIAGEWRRDGTGTLLSFEPEGGVLPTQSWVYVYFTAGIRDLSGTPLSPEQWFSFYTGDVADEESPVVVSVSPPEGATGVGINASVRLTFSEGINPLTVDAATVELRAGETVLPCTYSFSGENQVTVVPQVPLLPNTLHTLRINGVTDIAGNPTPAWSSTFRAAVEPDAVGPQVVKATPSGSGVTVNAIVEAAFNEAVDPATVSETTFQVRVGGWYGALVEGTTSLDTTGRVVKFQPFAPWATSTTYQAIASSVQDLSGNTSGYYSWTFQTGTAADDTPPAVVGVDPSDGDVGVTRNARVTVRVSEAVNPIDVETSLALSGPTGPVQGRVTLDGTRLEFLPLRLLEAGSTYRLRVDGLRDAAGNPQGAAFESGFDVGQRTDLVSPTVASVTPSSWSTGIPRDTVVRVELSEAVNPLSVDSVSVRLLDDPTRRQVEAVISIDGGHRVVVLTPTVQLAANTLYWLQLAGIRDTAGNSLSWYEATFRTE